MKPKKNAKRLLLACSLTGIVLVTVLLVMLTNPLAGRTETRIPVTADQTRIEADVTALIAAGAYRNWRYPEVLDRAADHIRSRWQAAGYQVEEQVYTVDDSAYRNLVVRYGRADRPRLVIGAHYDVFGDQDGADDNASSVAALLELSRLLATTEPQLPYAVEMVAYTLEEPPFFRSEEMGSYIHARSLADAGVTVRAMIALDCLGYFSDERGSQNYPAPGLGIAYPTRGNFIAVVGRTSEWGLTRKVKALLRGGSEIPVRSINAPAFVPGIDFSDHLSYWSFDVPAVLITNSALYRNQHYHRATDTADTLDYTRLTLVAQSLYALAIGFEGDGS